MMINYIKADLYRLRHKTANYVFWGIIAGLFLFIIVMSSRNIQGQDVGNFFMEITQLSLLQFGVIIIGGQAYYTVFIDDLASTNYPNLFSTGISKTRFVIAKMFTLIIYMFTLFIIGALFFFGVYGLLNVIQGGIGFNTEMFQDILLTIGLVFFSTLGFAAIANLITFWRQKTTFTTVFFFMMLTGLINQLLQLIPSIRGLEFLETPFSYTLTNYISEATAVMTFPESIDGTMLSVFQNAWIAGIVYFVVGSILSILVLKNVEIKETN